MHPRRRQGLEALLADIQDPATKEHYRAQFAMEDELQTDGLLDGQLPFAAGSSVTGGALRSAEPSARTYVFQWFKQGEDAACESLVVHTAGTAYALALFEQNAASGALVHNEHVSPRCEVLVLDADDCQTCFGAGKLTPSGSTQSVDCKACYGAGKVKSRWGI